MKDPYRYFRIEAREILDALSQGILGLERARGEVGRDEVERLLRASHTLKGAASVVQHEAIARQAHRLEDLIADYAADKVPFEELLAVMDAIEAELKALRGAPAVAAPVTIAEPVPPSVPAPSVRMSEMPRSVDPAAPPMAESVRLDLAEVDTLLASVADVGARLASARERVASIGEAEHLAKDLVDGLRSGALTLDRAQGLAGRLVAVLERRREDLGALVEGAQRRAGEALEDARNLRLLPAETLFPELTRAVRDAAAQGKREVTLETSGGDFRADGAVLQLVRDALLQLVRNSVAHGIEAPADRMARGKPAAGRIGVRFELRGARIAVIHRDDGQGLDLAGLRRAVLEKRPDAADVIDDLDAEGLLVLAMRRRVSTRGEASALAGRGVGLSVVIDAVDRLRGRIHVRNRPGEGLEIELELPVSVTAAPALVVAVGPHVFTLPLDAVTRTERVPLSEVMRSPEGDAIVVEHASYRFASLAKVLRLPDAPSEGGHATAVLLSAADARAAVGVDRVIGVANDVVLPLPPRAEASALVTGASLDGRGRPRLALDPQLLAITVGRLPGSPRLAAAAAPKRVLVIDDSLTSRMLEQGILEGAGYDVTTATSAEEGLEIARRMPFDLFVVDVEMPGMTGFDFVAKTRAEPPLATTPAVLVTSRATPEDKRRGLDAGARAYIVKGEFAQDAFLDAVRRLTG